MDFNDKQKKIIEEVRPYIDALSRKAMELDGEVCVTGFVFDPSHDLTIHFGNMLFHEPESVVVLHSYLSRMVCELLKRGMPPVFGLPEGTNPDDVGQDHIPLDRLSSAFNANRTSGGDAEPPPAAKKKESSSATKNNVESCLTTADYLVKMILMCPSSVVPIEITDAASQYVVSRGAKIQ